MTDVPPPAEPSIPDLASAPVCAVHEGAPATQTCERCGNYVCPLCLDPHSLFVHCEACRARVGADQVPWERSDGTWRSRWWQTLQAFLFRPAATIESARPGFISRALGFVAVTALLLGSIVTLLLSCVLGVAFAVVPSAFLGGGDLPSVAGGLVALVILAVLYPLLVLVAFYLSVGLRGLVFHGAATMLGGHGRMESSFWVVSYLHAIHVTVLPLAVIGQIPIIGSFIALFGHAAVEVYHSLQLTHAARRYHGLEGGYAVAAGWFPSFVLLLVVLGCCAIGLVGVLMGPR